MYVSSQVVQPELEHNAGGRQGGGGYQEASCRRPSLHELMKGDNAAELFGALASAEKTGAAGGDLEEARRRLDDLHAVLRGKVQAVDGNVVIRRLKEELLSILDELPPTVRAYPTVGVDAFVPESLFQWTGVIVGLEDTPHKDGVFFFQMDFPNNYPRGGGPKVKFTTKIFHCNISSNGNAAVNTYHWDPNFTITHLLLSLTMLLSDPDPFPAINQEAAQMYQRDKAEYNATVRDWVVRYAIEEPRAVLQLAMSGRSGELAGVTATTLAGEQLAEVFVDVQTESVGGLRRALCEKNIRCQNALLLAGTSPLHTPTAPLAGIAFFREGASAAPA